MRFVFATILSTIVFLATFQSGLLRLDYELNKDYYEALCINKDKPEMDCHGKCQMKKESEKQSSQNELIKLSFELNALPQPSTNLPENNLFSYELKENHFNPYKAPILSGHTTTLLQPPKNRI